MYSGAIWENPSDLSCFKACTSCFRCADKGKYDKCTRCSGRHDPAGKRDPYDHDDRCRCTEGVLQMRLQNGKLVLAALPNDPFVARGQAEVETQDEREWLQYLEEQREVRGDPDWDPIRFSDGESASNWTKDHRGGMA